MPAPLTPTETNTLFPWNVWMDGEGHTAIHHRDFHQEIGGFISMLRRQGAKALLDVETKVTGAVVWFRFYESEAPLNQRRASNRETA